MKANSAKNYNRLKFHGTRLRCDIFMGNLKTNSPKWTYIAWGGKRPRRERLQEEVIVTMLESLDVCRRYNL